MRFLLLLSALLASLGGIMSGAASAAVQVENSVSVGEHAGQVAARGDRPVAEGPVERDLPSWHVAAAIPRAHDRPLYADRLRE
jgi:hypothetical protein